MSGNVRIESAARDPLMKAAPCMQRGSTLSVYSFLPPVGFRKEHSEAACYEFLMTQFIDRLPVDR
jgi:hypothetical protein